jgi:hypothetical protein
MQFGMLLISAPAFGQSISPRIQPSRQYSPGNYMLFFVPNSQLPSEYLTYTPIGGTR